MTFHEDLKLKIHFYIKYVYRVTKNFPKDELYGITSQLRRSGMSVMLNYIEGYARNKNKDSKIYRNFLETSFGSLKESKYLIYFSYTENYLDKNDYRVLVKLSDEISGMIWGMLKKFN